MKESCIIFEGRRLDHVELKHQVRRVYSMNINNNIVSWVCYVRGRLLLSNSEHMTRLKSHEKPTVCSSILPMLGERMPGAQIDLQTNIWSEKAYEGT